MPRRKLYTAQEIIEMLSQVPGNTEVSILGVPGEWYFVDCFEQDRVIVEEKETSFLEVVDLEDISELPTIGRKLGD